MPYCVIVTCKHRSDLINFHTHGITYHRFPSNPKIKEKWITATARGPVWWPAKRSTICSEHFHDHEFQPLLKSRRLFDWAVPTLKLPVIPTKLSPKRDFPSKFIGPDNIEIKEKVVKPHSMRSKPIDPDDIKINKKVLESHNLRSKPIDSDIEIKTEVVEPNDMLSKSIESVNIEIKTEVEEPDDLSCKSIDSDNIEIKEEVLENHDLSSKSIDADNIEIKTKVIEPSCTHQSISATPTDCTSDNIISKALTLYEQQDAHAQANKDMASVKEMRLQIGRYKLLVQQKDKIIKALQKKTSRYQKRVLDLQKTVKELREKNVDSDRNTQIKVTNILHAKQIPTNQNSNKKSTNVCNVVINMEE